MFQSKVITTVVALVAFVIVLSVNVKAQATTPTDCQSVTGMSNVNATQLAGMWYEEVRAPAKNISCARINVSLAKNNTQLTIKTIYSATKSGYLMDKSDQATVNASLVNANTGFNVSYSSANGANTTYKILSTDYNTNLVMCGFTNSSDPTTSFGIILTRVQAVNSTWLMQVKNNASQVLTTLSGNNYANITQSTKCYTNSASTSFPVLTTLFAAFYALLKFMY
ncbi:hypothetical protein DOY81_004099 [Sarcophaga bullata]|nr:hypothetical protein DOY81_004099 [Sarcophaga bullata]